MTTTPWRGQALGPLNAQPDGFRLPDALGFAPDVEAALREALWRQVLLGRTDPELMLDVLQDVLPEWEVAPDEAREAFAAVIRARSEQQASWTPEQASTNLERAFAELEQIGVVARAHYSCCGTCAAAEIVDEIDDSRAWPGYLVSHQQDTESLIDDRATYVGYGVFLWEHVTEAEWERLDEMARDDLYARLVRSLMNNEVFPVLRRHGIVVTWNGDLAHRILLEEADYVVAV